MPTGNCNKQVVGNAGLFLVCHQLSLGGWNVLPTSRNAKGIDIVAYDDKTGTEFATVQVKTLSKPPYNVVLGKDAKLLAHFLVVVVLKKNEGPTCYVLNQSDVDKIIKYKHWLPRRTYQQDCFKNNWKKIKMKSKEQT